MESLLMLAAVIGLPLIVSLVVIDNIGRRVPAWRSEEQIQAATGAFWDRPAGSGRVASYRVTESRSEAVPEPTEPRRDARGAAPAGMAPTVNRRAA